MRPSAWDRLAAVREALVGKGVVVEWARNPLPGPRPGPGEGIPEGRVPVALLNVLIREHVRTHRGCLWRGEFGDQWLLWGNRRAEDPVEAQLWNEG
jgi:hypothetical protein